MAKKKYFGAKVHYRILDFRLWTSWFVSALTVSQLSVLTVSGRRGSTDHGRRRGVVGHLFVAVVVVVVVGNSFVLQQR